MSNSRGASRAEPPRTWRSGCWKKCSLFPRGRKRPCVSCLLHTGRDQTASLRTAKTHYERTDPCSGTPQGLQLAPQVRVVGNFYSSVQVVDGVGHLRLAVLPNPQAASATRLRRKNPGAEQSRLGTVQFSP